MLVARALCAGLPAGNPTLERSLGKSDTDMAVARAAGRRVRAMSAAPDAFSLRHIDLHGQQVAYRMAGQGPAVVLVHGLALSSTTWRPVMPALAERYTV